MSIAQSIFDAAIGAADARNMAMNEPCAIACPNGMEIFTFQDRSALVFINFIQAVFVAKGN